MQINKTSTKLHKVNTVGLSRLASPPYHLQEGSGEGGGGEGEEGVCWGGNRGEA